MKKFFITGISGSGKSSVLEKINEKGFSVIDIDSVGGLCKWIHVDTQREEKWSHGMTEGWYKSHKYICDKKKLSLLIASSKSDVFVAGLPSNRRDLLELFDKVFFLQCKEDTSLKRIKERISHDFGKHVLEQENLLSWYKDFEADMLNRGAISINTDRPLVNVAEDILTNI